MTSTNNDVKVTMNSLTSIPSTARLSSIACCWCVRLRTTQETMTGSLESRLKRMPEEKGD
jgi:hypothetical protein